MAAYTRQLIDGESNKIYPVARADATYLRGGTTTVETVLDDIREGGSKTEFLENGNIKETLASGNIVTTEFIVDGSIMETTTDSKGNKIDTKTTVFNEDGSIETKIKYEGE